MTENQTKVIDAVREAKRMMAAIAGFQKDTVLTDIVRAKCDQDYHRLCRVEAWLVTAFSRGDMQPAGQIAKPKLDNAKAGVAQ